MALLFSEACERNKDPILAHLRQVFGSNTRVLEIGSGTAQHAVYFGWHLPHVDWQTSDLPEHLPGIRERVAAEAPPNVREPVALDVSSPQWPVDAVDAVFSANTLHIMSWDSVREFFRGTGQVLEPGGTLCVYGPFRYRGDFTTPSNARFDASLKARDPESGIRDFETVDELAREQGLVLAADHAMPANNQLLVWRREAA